MVKTIFHVYLHLLKAATYQSINWFIDHSTTDFMFDNKHQNTSKQLDIYDNDTNY